MSDDKRYDYYPYKIIINEFQQQISDQQKIIDDQSQTIARLKEENLASSQELKRVLNSRGWQFLEKTRKLSRRKSNSTAMPKNQPQTAQKSIFPPYLSQYEENISYSKLGYNPEAKAIAFYLPQFHTFKENDTWWGKGFTEWTNTKKTTPKFVNHYQPREPHDDIGYYQLDNIESIKKQVNLAQQHGIYGFCFYHYWFSGKRLMKKPVDLFLKHKEINFPFCLCWANENWTRTWDGLNKDVLIEQKYKKDDPVNFMKELEKYLKDPRYITVDNKPIILIYAPESIPNLEKTIRIWRETAKKIGIGEILIWTKSSILDHSLKNTNTVDAEFDFAPTGCTFRNAFIESNEEHTILDYSKLVEDYYSRHLYYNHFPIKPFYYSCTLGWDNSPRRKKGYCTLVNYSTERFYDWLSLIIEETKRRYPKDKRFVFINAWNEWAEGTYLEPDKKYGYANINAASKAIYGLPYKKDKNTIILDKESPRVKNSPKAAIQIHAFYPDILKEVLLPLSKMKSVIDIFITTDTSEKSKQIKKIFNSYNLKIKELSILPNVGRDVFPFLSQIEREYKQYDIIGHFHTKKTPQSFYGDSWRKQIYSSLLDSPSNIERIFKLLEDPTIGIVMPEYYYNIRKNVEIGSNLNIVNKYLKKSNFSTIKSSAKITFPAGTMFWAKTKSIQDIFELKLTQNDFDEEAGQLDGTTAHAIERLLGIIPEKKGYRLIKVINKA